MDDRDWWPALLSHIPKENPWNNAHVVVAEIKSFDDTPYSGQRISSSALVPIDQLEQITQKLSNFNHEVSTSGPHPSFAPDSTYVPTFWVSAHDLPSTKYEPLVLSWHSHDKTILLPDPGFLMTYGLTPRTLGNGVVCWDDPAAPVHDVVKVSSPSIWKYPSASTATVSISKDYLQDYLTLRKLALVQVYWETRWGSTDGDMDRKLGDEEAVTVDLSDRKFQLNRGHGTREAVAAQVWGGRLIATPRNLPISGNSMEKDGLAWPGFPEPVTDEMATTMNMSNRAYVDDSVLGAYEGRPGFSVHPKSGSVTFGTQWSVGFCDRVGRNLIRLELKKLYEGAPPNVIRHWNKFAVDPLPDEAYPAALEIRNIAIRAEELTMALVALGESLATLAHAAGRRELNPENFVSLRRHALEYHGWWTLEETDAISRHVPINCSMDAFLDRCSSLNKISIEGLSEGNFRRTLQAIGVPAKSIATYRTLKLLDCVVRMAQVANTTGLKLSVDGKQIWERLTKEGTQPFQPVAYLFALYDIRTIADHKTGERHANLMKELARFGVSPGEEASGYGKILDDVYDALAAQLRESAAKIAAVSF